MARSNRRRMLSLDCLESRRVLSTTGGPSAQAQYMLELLNETRTNPAAMAQQITSNLNPDEQATIQYYGVNLNSVTQKLDNATPQPPLAWNGSLAAAATGQSQYQANIGQQTHDGPNGETLGQRIQDAGYQNASNSTENAYAYSTSINQAMKAFVIDWGVSSDGHFNNIMEPGTSANNSFRDVGIGVVNTNNNGLGPMVITQDFGAQAGEQSQLVGVVYNDPNLTHQFAANSGVGGVTIQAVNTATGQVSSTQTWDAGGYQLPLSPGNYQVTAIDNGQVVNTQSVTINDVNVQANFDLNDPWQGGPATLTAPLPQPIIMTPPTPAPQPVVVTPPTPQAVVVTPPTPVVVTPPTPTPQPVVSIPMSTAVIVPNAAPVVSIAQSTPVVSIAQSTPVVSTPTPTVAVSYSSSPTPAPSTPPAFNPAWITNWTAWKATDAANAS